MRSLLLFVVFLCALTLSNSVAPSVSNAASSAKQRALVKFDQPVQLMAETLNGEYLFVHNDEAMMRGESCTFVYEGRAENDNNLVISFHCMPVQRAKAASFTVRTSQTAAGYFEIREFQFAGSTEAHLVPLNQHSAHVTISSLIIGLSW